MVPQEIEKISTNYRTIKTPLPVPESLSIFESLAEAEPRSMLGQPPIIWHKAEGFQVFDPWGNRWIDWTSGVLVANAGHGRKEIRKAIEGALKQPLLMSYAFVHEQRFQLVRELQALSPEPAEYRVFLLSTGSEGIENSIKLAKTYAMKKYGPGRKYIVSFDNAFHGRTLGAQLAGGQPKQKNWIIDEGKTFVQVPFPDGYINKDTGFELFLTSLEAKRIKPEEIAGVLTESYQGGGANFLPVDYAQQLEEFCRSNDIVSIYDEVQAGFGRTGRMFTYQHYGVKPDLIVCGKGISSSLPLSAVIGRKEVMDLYPPGSMTSTHSASPLPVAAALASLKIIREEGLVENAQELGKLLSAELEALQARYPKRIGCVHCRGLVAGVQIVRPGTNQGDPESALRLTEICYQKGVLLCAPVGDAGQCLKIAPPLMINRDALMESLSVLKESCAQLFG
jgi:4-aminobutyrate aminotransferase-like enzyme